MLLPLLVLPAILLLLLLYTIYKPPFFLIRHFQHRWPDILWHAPTGKRIVALTIDDTPSEHTNEILSILQANGANATFFIIGSQVQSSNPSSNPSPSHNATLRDLVLAGNELGNHAMHDEPSRALSDDVLRDEIKEVEAMIRDAYGSSSNDDVEGSKAGPAHNYFRPGSGFFSARMRRLVKGLGYRLVLGSVYPHDPQIPYWRVNASHILGSVRPGSIIICHDRRCWTAPMLRKVLPELKRRGYQVVTVTQLLDTI